MLWILARRGLSGRDQSLLRFSKQYEWLFWGGMGLLALTGVGNLGNFGTGLPGIRTAWGSRLSIKLSLVLALILFSSFRTWLVLGLSNHGGERSASPEAKLLHILYAGTSLLIAAILILAVSLSHG